MNISFVIRIAKIALVAFFGAYAALVTLSNVTDPLTNLAFVEHVVAMDTTFQSDSLMWRSVESKLLQRVFFGLIVVTEAVVAGFCLFGAFRLFVARRAEAPEFHAAKGPAIWGLLLGLALWFFGFQVIGAEWFASWQSETWNGLSAAARTTAFLLGTLVFVSLQND